MAEAWRAYFTEVRASADFIAEFRRDLERARDEQATRWERERRRDRIRASLVMTVYWALAAAGLAAWGVAAGENGGQQFGLAVVFGAAAVYQVGELALWALKRRKAA